MKQWFPAMIILVVATHGSVDARSYRSIAERREAAEQDAAPPAVSQPTAPPSAPPASPPPQPVPTGGAAVTATPGAKESQIFVWKEGNVLRATNNPDDVPPRYSKRVASPDGNPKVIRMVAEDDKPRTAKPVKKSKKKLSRRHEHKPPR